jgi:hypothetical protein
MSRATNAILCVAGPFLTLVAANLIAAAAETLGGDPLKEDALYLVLDRMGRRLDCYFTIEELPSERDNVCNWISQHSLPGDGDAKSVPELVSWLSKHLKGVHVFRSDENPAVIHLMDARLVGAKSYPLAKTITLRYEGDLQGLRKAAGKAIATDFSLFANGGIGGWPPLITDFDNTKVRCVAKEQPVRRLFTDCIPLSRYERIIWLAGVELKKGGGYKVGVQYLGQMEHPIPHAGRFRGKVDFEAGEVIYANTVRTSGAKPHEDPVHSAMRFIREQMKEREPRQVRWAMFYLGKVKAEEGVPLLLKYVDYRYTTCGMVEESYPAVRGLTEIGQPAVQAALNALAREPNALRARLLTRVILNVSGAKDGAKQVQEVAEQADADVRQRLQTALQYWAAEDEAFRSLTGKGRVPTDIDSRGKESP